jgi:hypothetical protein
MTAVTDDGLAALAQQCVSLHTLRLRKCGKLRGEEALLAVAQNGVLRRLDVSLNRGVSGRLLLELAAFCASTLSELDVSFCRAVQPEAFGFLLDKCNRLTEVRVFGCSQLTRACAYGHANENVLVVGTPTFKADEVAVLLPDAAGGGSDDDAEGALGAVQSLAAVSGASDDSDGMEVI